MKGQVALPGINRGYSSGLPRCTSGIGRRPGRTGGLLGASLVVRLHGQLVHLLSLGAREPLTSDAAEEGPVSTCPACLLCPCSAVVEKDLSLVYWVLQKEAVQERGLLALWCSVNLSAPARAEQLLLRGPLIAPSLSMQASQGYCWIIMVSSSSCHCSGSGAGLGA